MQKLPPPESCTVAAQNLQCGVTSHSRVVVLVFARKHPLLECTTYAGLICRYSVNCTVLLTGLCQASLVTMSVLEHIAV